MKWVLDLIFLVFAAVTAPFWLWRMASTGKLRTNWRARFGCGDVLPPCDRPTILLHAVSVGEVNAIRLLVERVSQTDQHPRVVIATTTDTGFRRATELFSQRFTVVRYPFDFSFAVNRFLNRVQPDVVALIELELWPNFTAQCTHRNIPICIVNGRLSERSYRWYKRLRVFVSPSFRRLSFTAVQNSAYAERFISMGVPKDCVHITDTMKWDTAELTDDVPGSDALAQDMGIDRTKPLVVAGSTAPDEHLLLINAIPKGVQLLCAPRRPEWFDDAADILKGCVRRTTKTQGSATGRFLLDTIGELRKAYALADVIVIGRSFGSLHGSDMIEAVALGKATIIGPAVTDFQETVAALLEHNGIIQTDRRTLPTIVRELLDNPTMRTQIAEQGRAVIRAHQGATDRQVRLLMNLLN